MSSFKIDIELLFFVFLFFKLCLFFAWHAHPGHTGGTHWMSLGWSENTLVPTELTGGSDWGHGSLGVSVETVETTIVKVVVVLNQVNRWKLAALLNMVVHAVL